MVALPLIFLSLLVNMLLKSVKLAKMSQARGLILMRFVRRGVYVYSLTQTLLYMEGSNA